MNLEEAIEGLREINNYLEKISIHADMEIITLLLSKFKEILVLLDDTKPEREIVRISIEYIAEIEKLLADKKIYEAKMSLQESNNAVLMVLNSEQYMAKVLGS